MTEKKTEKTEKKQRGAPKQFLFKKGESGNPNGRPPGTFSLLTLLKNKLQEIPKDQQKSYAEGLINSMLNKAINEGDSQTQKLIWNYIEGLPQGALDITTLGEKIEGVLVLPEREFKNKHNENSVETPAETSESAS